MYSHINSFSTDFMKNHFAKMGFRRSATVCFPRSPNSPKHYQFNGILVSWLLYTLLELALHEHHSTIAAIHEYRYTFKSM